MTYGIETAALTKRQVEQLETAEMKMPSFTLGVTKLEKIRNRENISKKQQEWEGSSFICGP